MKYKYICLDFDDFCDENNKLDLLFKLKQNIPNLKLTLFVIPNRSSDKLLYEVSQLRWIEMGMHGFNHFTPYECSDWTYEEAMEKIDICQKRAFFAPLWKSPGWLTSDGLYKALVEKNLIIADQPYNNARRPPQLKYYLLDKEWKVHGHIPNECGNGLVEKWDFYNSLEADEFLFVTQAVHLGV